MENPILTLKIEGLKITVTPPESFGGQFNIELGKYEVEYSENYPKMIRELGFTILTMLDKVNEKLAPNGQFTNPFSGN